MTPQYMAIARRVRLELILLGMALSRPGDREKILKTISPADLHSDVVVDMIQAIGEQDAEIIRTQMNLWGCPIQDTVADSLLKRMREIGDQERARDVLTRCQFVTGSELKEVLSQALEEIK